MLYIYEKWMHVRMHASMHPCMHSMHARMRACVYSNCLHSVYRTKATATISRMERRWYRGSNIGFLSA